MIVHPLTELAPGTVATLQAQPLTYDDPGVTRAGTGTGALGLDRRLDLGSGRRAWERAVDGLMSWQAQVGAGLHVTVSAPRVAVGEVVTLGFGPGWLGLRAPCRVVWTVDEPTTCGFAYGTLPGHPESGEEAFTLTRGADDHVWFAVSASSRPATFVARCGGPVTRRVQHHIVDRYLQAMRRLAGGDSVIPD